METIYIVIVAFLLILAVFDLFVGVSNDAVNFLQSAIGAKAARFRTVLIVASVGVAVGAMMSAGMMDVARHGIMHPVNYSFHEVMVVFLAVMVTDVIVLDMFNTLGLPTSTTVSLVFELLGGTFILAILKINADPSLSIEMLLNSDKALSVIIAIFGSTFTAEWLKKTVFVLEYFFTVFFTLEYILRIYCSRNPKGYVLSLFGIIDLLSILPMYLGFFLPQVQYAIIFRCLRLVRVFRVLKLFSFLTEGNVLIQAILASWKKIGFDI